MDKKNLFNFPKGTLDTIGNPNALKDMADQMEAIAKLLRENAERLAKLPVGMQKAPSALAPFTDPGNPILDNLKKMLLQAEQEAQNQREIDARRKATAASIIFNRLQSPGKPGSFEKYEDLLDFIYTEFKTEFEEKKITISPFQNGWASKRYKGDDEFQNKLPRIDHCPDKAFKVGDQTFILVLNPSGIISAFEKQTIPNDIADNPYYKGGEIFYVQKSLQD